MDRITHHVNILEMNGESYGAAAAPVYLCASPHRVFHGGPRPEWAIELVPGPN